MSSIPAQVLESYSDDCQPTTVEFLASAGGFSGGQLWRMTAPRGILRLRRWPEEFRDANRLRFIHAVLAHVDRHGFKLVPLPISTRLGETFVADDGLFWELAPWLPGEADFFTRPHPDKLPAAMRTLAEFHVVAATFPGVEPAVAVSPGIVERRGRLLSLLGGQWSEIADAIQLGDWPELTHRSRRVQSLFHLAAPRVARRLADASEPRVALQPCIRDIHDQHVLFDGPRVTGLIDFAAMRIDNVATDVARLLGSLAGDDAPEWQRGITAYEAIRPLSEDERRLLTAFDESSVLLSGVNWIDWIYRQGRVFEDRASVLARLDAILARLTQLSGGTEPGILL